jgi:hypothetical protein
VSAYTPDLDARTHKELMRQALAIVKNNCPQWNDHSAADPGITLMEVFAYLTEILIYRVNRFPDRAHRALLDLIGVSPRAPSAAEATLTFTRSASEAGQPDVTIPAGTLACDNKGALVFTTLSDAVLPARPAGQAGTPQTVDVLAINAEEARGELAGVGSSEPGQSCTIRRGPILRRPADPLSLIVGVEVDASDRAAGQNLFSFQGKTYSRWREARSFAGCGPQDQVYVANRGSGVIAFGPADVGGEGARNMGAAPAKGREIRVWYWRGGGRAGNLDAGQIEQLKSPLRDITVVNKARASGGEDIETLERAMRRGREEGLDLRSAVTAADFERVACETPGVARALAFAQRDVWPFGRPGVVDILLVPKIDLDACPDGVTGEVLAAHQTVELLSNARELTKTRRPIGVESRLAWARCRPVSVSARVVAHAAEDRAALKARLTRRLHELLAPDGGWPFGRTLRASDIYEILLGEPGVRYAERLRFRIADAPAKNIADLMRDDLQPTTFYASGGALYRTLDTGESWTAVFQRPGEAFLGARTSRHLPGRLAAFSCVEAGGRHAVYVSLDGGETFDDPARAQNAAPEDRLAMFGFNFEIRDLAWSARDREPALLVAGRAALQRIRFSNPPSVEVVPVRGAAEADVAADQHGFEAVATARHVSGLEFVAVATRERKGVYLSAGGDKFIRHDDTVGKNIRLLAFQQRGADTLLWAGLSAERGEEGQGAISIGMRVDGGFDPTGWTAYKDNWSGGSCESLDFLGERVAAGTNRSGVLTLTMGPTPRWSDPSPLSCGLPLVNERKSLPPARGAAFGLREGREHLLFGGEGGVYASSDGGAIYADIGRDTFEDRTPLPRNWLFCSGEIALDVANESGGD